MIKEIFEKKEKKVEYVELIYDLIFVYVIGRNNSLLRDITDGFVRPEAFIAYLLCTLAVIQIWNYTTYYINIFGRNGTRDHIFMFVNMFLLYFMGQSTNAAWGDFHTQYHVAWALILINIGIQYVIEYRNHRGDPAAEVRIRRMAAILLTEAGIVLAALPEFALLHTTFCSMAAVAFGIIAVILFGQRGGSAAIDFTHLSERAMLYVVFTFGEMIVGLAVYFEGKTDPNTVYFAAFAFLIVVALFLSYEAFYDHIIDREMRTNGIGYICLHIFIIFFLNNITSALLFMRNEEVLLMPKILFLTASVVLYYVFLFAAGKYAKKKCRLRGTVFLKTALIGIAFAVLMILFRENMYVNIAVTVVCLFAVYAVIHSYGVKMDVS